MAASSSEVTPSGFFVLRTPLLPHRLLTEMSAALRAPQALGADQDLSAALTEDRERLLKQLRAAVLDPVIREALFVASPSLDEAIESWLANADSVRAERVVVTLVRYLARMAARPTPFGLFAGCSVGVFGAETALSLVPSSSYKRHTRLDMHYLSTLCDTLHQDPTLRKDLSFRPSTGLYVAAGRLRYAERRADARSRALSYDLVSVERTVHLDATLRRAQRGARPHELVEAIIDQCPEVASEDAEGYIDQLIDSQILTSDLAPAVTGDEPIRSIRATLDGLTEGKAVAAVLEQAEDAVRALDDAGLGVSPSRYREIANALASLSAKPDLARLFHVDLYKPTSRAVLGAEVEDEMLRAVGLMARLGDAEREDLNLFRKALRERYGERLDGPPSEQTTVPLVEVLDEEAGIGFDSQWSSSEPSPLLDDLLLPPEAAAPRVPFGPREQHVLRRLSELYRDRKSEWVLQEEDLSIITSKTQAQLPSTFALMATLTAPSPDALVRGDFRLIVHGLNGPSGAVLLGRFCHGDESLRCAVEAHLRAEEAARPDAIFAEIVHLSEGRLGNILCRPTLRAYEIVYLGRSGVPEGQRIPITDLRVGLSRGRLFLYSARHAREVIPRLTSAHNYGGAALGIYRFLCALQQEGLPSRFGWTWGPLARAPFLPRVSCGRTVLSMARWNAAKDQLLPLGNALGAERYRAVQRLRTELGLPRWVGLADGDNVLPIDLDNVLHVESFVRRVKGHDSTPLIELLANEGLVAEGPEGRFVHELVVPFVATRDAPTIPPPHPSEPTVARSFLPGSDWLYAKLYTGTATADIVLGEVIAPLIKAARNLGALRRWFFIRYGDPQWQVRLRIRGEPRWLASTMVPTLYDAAEPLLRDGCIWKLQLDTYEREVGRYGGADGIELAEAIFEADSDAVLSIVQLLETNVTADARWRLALLGMHMLLVDLGFDLAVRLDILRQARATLWVEYHGDLGFAKQLGTRFRKERRSLEALLTSPVNSDYPLDRAFQLLAQRSEKILPLAAELSSRERDGRLTLPVRELAVSFLHMHANRLLRSEQRAQEHTLYEFLLRLYESETTRARSRR